MDSNGNPISGNIAGDLTVEDDLSMGGDLTITGNLTVSGTTTTINTEVLTVEDPIVLIGAGNQSDLNDAGIIVEYNASTDSRYAGFIRDKDGVVGTNKRIWKLVDNLTQQPVSSANNSVLYDNNLTDLRVRNLDVDGISSDNILNQNQIFTNSIDQVNSVPLIVGSINATSIDVGKNNVPTNIRGTLQIQNEIELENYGEMRIARANTERLILCDNIFVNNQRIDTEFNTQQLNIGTVNSNQLDISRSGITTFVRGDFQADNQVKVNGSLLMGGTIDSQNPGDSLNIASTNASQVNIFASVTIDQKLTANNFGDDDNQNLFIGQINDPTPTGSNNISIGLNTGDALTSGSNSVFVGNNCGTNIQTGNDNVFIGLNSGRDVVSGSSNCFVGPSSGKFSTSNNNVALGVNSCGGTANIAQTGDGNTCIGFNSLRNLTSGEFNTAIGANTMNNISTGSYNVHLGTGANSGIIETSYALKVGINDGSQKDLLNGQFDTGTLNLGQSNTSSIIRTLGTTNSTSNITGSVQLSGGLGVAASLYANNLFNNHVAVYMDGSNNVQGLPTASGGFHTLEDNKNYVVYGQITLTNGIQFGANNSVRGDGFSSQITFDESSNNIVGFKSVDQNVYVSQLTIVGGGGFFSNDDTVFLFDCTNYNLSAGSPFFGRNKRFKVSHCNILRPRQVGDITGFGTLNISNNFINGGGTSGLQTLTENGFYCKAGLSLEFSNNKVVLFKGSVIAATGYMLRLGDEGSTGFNAVNISGNIFHPRNEERGILFDNDSSTALGTISSNTFIRTGGTAPLIDYEDQPTYDNYNVPSLVNYLVDNNAGIDNSEAELEATMTSSAGITSATPQEIEFLNNAQLQAITRTKRWGVLLELTDNPGFPVIAPGQRITDIASGNSAYVIASGNLLEMYLVDFSGPFSATSTGFSQPGAVNASGGLLKPRFIYAGGAPRQLTLTSTWNITSGNNSSVSLYPGDGTTPDLDCESITITSASGVGSSMALTCSRRYNQGDILNFYASRSSGNTFVNKAVICVH